MHRFLSLIAVLAVLNAHGGEILIEKGSIPTKGTQLIPVDTAKHYDLVIETRGAKGSFDLRVYQYDRQKRQLGAYMVAPSPETLTALVFPVKAGDRQMTIAQGENWNLRKHGNIIAFNAKPDLSDLPNRTYEYYATSVKRTARGWTVQLNQPLSRNYAAGTGVRLHQDGGHLEWTRLPTGKSMRWIINPAPPYGLLPNTWWRGTAYAKIAFATCADTPITAKYELAEIPPAELDRRLQARLAEKQRLAPFGNGKIIRQDENTIEFLNGYFMYKDIRHYYGGVQQRELAIPTAQARQFECDFKSTTSGYLELDVTLQYENQNVKIRTPPRSVIPDGKYRRLIFPLTNASQWRENGTVIYWSLSFRHYVDTGRVIGFQNPRFKNEINIIPDAENLKKDTTTTITGMRPNGKYRLAWKNGTCTGAKLVFFDHRLAPIPDSEINFTAQTREIVFQTPEQLILARLLLDGSFTGHPCLTTVNAPRRYTPDIFWRGKWIWHRLEEGPNYTHTWFGEKIRLDDQPRKAWIAVMADDMSETFINNVSVGKTWRYSRPSRFDITPYLKKGENRIDIRVYNLDQASGLCADFYALEKNGNEIFKSTDDSWLCHFNDKAKDMPQAYEKHAVILGAPESKAPWAAHVKFVYAGPNGVLKLIKTENGEFTALVEKDVVGSKWDMGFKAESASGKTETPKLPVTIAKNPDGTITVRYPPFPRRKEDITITLNDEFWTVRDNQPLARIKGLETERKKELQQAKFIRKNGRMFLDFKGKLHDPTFFATSEWERIVPAKNIGFNNFLITTTFEEFWVAPGQYDFKKLDRNVQTLTQIVPDAIFMLDIRFFMPEWWIAKNPDDTSQYWEKTRRNTYDDVQALGSKKWLADAETPLRMLIQHVRNSDYADRIWGANIGDSRGNEWFWGGATAGQDRDGKPAQPGYSPADLHTFRNMLRKWYRTDQQLAEAWNSPGLTFENAQMPDHHIRRRGDVGSLFNPRQKRQFMDWCRFRNQSLAEALIHFAGRIKSMTQRKWLVGAYYGYMTELSSNPNRSQLITGHNGFLEYARCPDLDFVRAPARYDFRKTGMANGVMQAFSSFAMRDKVVFIENDERNAYGPLEGDANDIYTGRASTALESVGHLNREFGMMTTLGLCHYWYDHPRGSLYEPALLAAIGDQLKCYAQLPPVKGLTPVQLAVVGDTESIYYSIDGTKGIFVNAVSNLFQLINSLACPFSNLVVADLLEPGVVPAHKCYIMLPTLVLSREQRKALLRRFQEEEATVLWIYAAGSCYPDEGPKGDFCGDFLGMKCEMVNNRKREIINLEKTREHESGFLGSPLFYPVAGYDSVLGTSSEGKPLLVVKQIGKSRHVFSTLPDPPREAVAKVADMAGVFRYASSRDDKFWIGNDLVFLYANTNGRKSIRLPRPDLRLRPVIAPDQTRLAADNSWHAIAGLTYGFIVEKKE